MARADNGRQIWILPHPNANDNFVSTQTLKLRQLAADAQRYKMHGRGMAPAHSQKGSLRLREPCALFQREHTAGGGCGLPVNFVTATILPVSYTHLTLPTIYSV